MSGTNRLNVFSYIITVDVLIQKENMHLQVQGQPFHQLENLQFAVAVKV